MNLKGSRVLLTGACGTIGRELLRQLLSEHELGEVVAIDNNESELFFLEQNFCRHTNARYVLADIRDGDKINRVMEGVDVVFHAAALKHVILCERSPFEAVQTNIVGVKNVIQAALNHKVERVIFTSSDKAVNPTSVMGTSKLMGERLMTAANSNLRRGGTIFASTRFGNVLGSRGSVIAIFREQIKQGRSVTITDERMTRFIMNIRQAARLVIDAGLLCRGGEVFITKMSVMRITDLAPVMIQELAPLAGRDPDQVKVEVIGMKPGEKLHEELMSEEETRRALELRNYYVVLPAFRSLYREIKYEYPGVVNSQVSKAYNSGQETPLDRQALVEFLRVNDLLRPESLEAPTPPSRYWPDGSDGGSCGR